MTTPYQEKRYDRRDKTLKFVDRPNDLDPYSEEEGCLRAEMSCGHAVIPELLTRCCLIQLNEGQFIFKCPATKEGTSQRCDAVWSYQEVRKMAMLTPEECRYFEEKIVQQVAMEYCEIQECPECKTFVERTDPINLSVRCTVCTKDKGTVFEFCWQCLKPWKGSDRRADRCGNVGCYDNHVLSLLKNCEMIKLPEVKGADACPSIRACPTCGQRVEHNRRGCKNITCTRCKKEFCFLCLKLSPDCQKTSSHYIPCSNGVAPRQTFIPVWKGN